MRGLGHGLKPVVTVGDAGVTDAVIKEFDNTIDHHELIKVKVRAADREARDTAIERICRQGNAELVTRIGNVALLFRRNADKPRIRLPAARRARSAHS